mmetsp:Transcript_107592/g.343349  ORF Transcript_107592/g.343349 Transcript_107592/m.343349 type:complete len:133 (+) Transcript_107592:73-471(+)
MGTSAARVRARQSPEVAQWQAVRQRRRRVVCLLPRWALPRALLLGPEARALPPKSPEAARRQTALRRRRRVVCLLPRRASAMVLLLEPEARHSPEAALCQRLPQPPLLQEVQVASCRTFGMARPGPPYNHAT